MADDVLIELDEYSQRFRNVRAFLALIRACEGTASPNGYRYLFGSTYDNERLFADYGAHPNVKQQFHQNDGTVGYTTAAGAYQFIYPTWSRMCSKLDLTDFSPASQDRAAIALIQERGCLIQIEEGNVQVALDVLWIEWASLPASQYAQPKRSLDFAMAAYTRTGGAVA